MLSTGCSQRTGKCCGTTVHQSVAMGPATRIPLELTRSVYGLWLALCYTFILRMGSGRVNG